MNDTSAKPVIVISGANSGIGHAMARELLARGHAVLGLVRDAAKAPLEHRHYRQQCVDLSDPEALQARIAELCRCLDVPLRALVNNAGIGRMGYLEQLSVGDLREVMNINFLSHAIVTRAFLPLLKRQRHGDIVFVGSEAALHGSQQGRRHPARGNWRSGSGRRHDPQAQGPGSRQAVLRQGAAQGCEPG